MNWPLLLPYFLLAPSVILLRFLLEATHASEGFSPWLSIFFLVAALSLHLPLRTRRDARRPYLWIYAGTFAFLMWCQIWIATATTIEFFLKTGTHHQIPTTIRDPAIMPRMDTLPTQSLRMHLLWHVVLGAGLIGLVTGTISCIIFYFRTGTVDVGHDPESATNTGRG